MTRVVVTVLAFRSAATIADAVRSALGQTYDGPVDVLVREQGGDDRERRMLDDLAAETANSHAGRSLTVDHGPNLGFAGGHERLLRTETARRADVVVLLNADARLEPTFLTDALGAFDDPTVGAVQPKVLRPDASMRGREGTTLASRRPDDDARGVLLLPRGPTLPSSSSLRAPPPTRRHAQVVPSRPLIDAAGIVVCRNRRAEARCQGEPDDGRADVPGEVFGVDGAVAVYRRRALDDVAVPGPDGPEVLATALGSYHEDVELAWRLRWRGWTTSYVPTAVAWHARTGREDPGVGRVARVRRRGGIQSGARRQAFANARLVTLRVEQPRRVARDLVPVLTRELGGWLLLAITRPADVPAAAVRIARGLRPALRARRAILHGRRQGADPYAWLDRPFVPATAR